MSKKISVLLEIRSSECIRFVIRVFYFNISKNLDEIKLISLTNRQIPSLMFIIPKIKPLSFCREHINDIA